MGKTFDVVDDALAGWLARQPVFFVATAPLQADGHVNLSPKGLDSFAVLDGRTVAYLDLTGSGVETIAHLRENGRITLLFCAFEGAPKIVRCYGTGEVIEVPPNSTPAPGCSNAQALWLSPDSTTRFASAARAESSSRLRAAG